MYTIIVTSSPFTTLFFYCYHRHINNLLMSRTSTTIERFKNGTITFKMVFKPLWTTKLDVFLSSIHNITIEAYIIAVKTAVLTLMLHNHVLCALLQ